VVPYVAIVLLLIHLPLAWGITRNVEIVQRGAPSKIAALILVVVLSGAFACGYLSSICKIQGEIGYKPFAELIPANAQPFQFFVAYLLYTFDLIPGLDFRETMGWKDEFLIPTVWYAGVPLLLYRVLVYAPVLGVLKTWIERQQKNGAVSNPGAHATEK
jgi:hypothetical protein